MDYLNIIDFSKIRTAEDLSRTLTNEVVKNVGLRGAEEIAAYESSKEKVRTIMTSNEPPKVTLMNRDKDTTLPLDVPESVKQGAIGKAKRLWEDAIADRAHGLVKLYTIIQNDLLEQVAFATANDAFDRGLAKKGDFDCAGLSMADSVAILTLCRVPDSMKVYHLLLESHKAFGAQGPTAELPLLFDTGMLVSANLDEGEQYDEARKLFMGAVAKAIERGINLGEIFGPWFFLAPDRSMIGLIYTGKGFIGIPASDMAQTNPFLVH